MPLTAFAQSISAPAIRPCAILFMGSLAGVAARCDIQRFTRLASLTCRDRIAHSNRFVSPRSALFHIRPPPHLILSPARFLAAGSVHARLFLIWFSAPLSRDLDTAVASSAHGCHEISAPMLRDLRTGSTTRCVASTSLPGCAALCSSVRCCRSPSSPSERGSGLLNATESGTGMQTIHIVRFAEWFWWLF
jgi:hypothetical protein